MAENPSGCDAILVVDDDSVVRAVVARTLERRGYAVRTASTGEQALDAAAEELPRLVILDVCLPGLSGYEVCHTLRQDFGKELPILFISGRRVESFDRVAGLLVGADDYLVKPFSPDELLARVRVLLRRARPARSGVADALTPRETEVLRLLASGLGEKEIVARLFISPKTVRTHIEHILAKLGVHSRAQAVAVAYRDGLIEAPT